MEVMPCQYQLLHEALSGYLKTGIPLVAYDGSVLKPAGVGDDIGIYYFIPKITYTLGISIDQCLKMFFVSIILVSLFLGIFGYFLLIKKPGTRWVGIVEVIVLACGSYFHLEGVYIILFSITIAIIPLFLYLSKGQRFSLSFAIFLLLSGLAIGVANYLRSHAGTGVLIFMVMILVFYVRIKWKQKLFLLMLLITTVLTSIIYFETLMNRRDVYLTNHDPSYKSAPRRHVLWHSAYIGFGFLNNEYGIKYKDEVAMEKVCSIAPKTTYLSQDYEEILRHEVFKLIEAHPLFTVQTMFAKLGVILFYLLLFGNVGLIAVALRKIEWPLQIAFGSAMIFNSLFGIIATPDYRYLMGFISFATLWGIITFDEAIRA